MLQPQGKTALPTHLLKRTYQNELRAIGRYCDDKGFRHIGVYEVSEGFVLRGFCDPNDPFAITAFEFPEEDFQGLIMKNFTSRNGSSVSSHPAICPTGYEDFFRALGYELEEDQAKGVVVQELPDLMVVTYLHLGSSSDSYVWEPKSVLLNAAQVEEMLDKGFRRRDSES
jgi:hypothetical protein